MENESGGKRFEGFVFHCWLTVAIVFDAISVFIPVGFLFLTIARLSFMLGDYPGGTGVYFLRKFIIETIPIISIWPACTTYVFQFKAVNNLKTKKQENIANLNT